MIAMPRIEFPSDDGTVLEARLTHPDEDPVGGAVLCHPHPQQGGSMDSWMMPVLQRAVAAAGWSALRFNFRGVGRSDGAPGEGEEEARDVAGAVTWLRAEIGGGPIILGGWSFGSAVALNYALDGGDIAGWFAVGFPVGRDAVDLDALSGWTTPKLFIHGTRDQITPAEEVEAIVEAAAEPKRLRLIEGGDHLLAQHGDILAAEVTSFVESLP
jgi:uncharacterized protein